MGFCNAAQRKEYDSIPSADPNGNVNPSNNFVTERPLGPRPDLEADLRPKLDDKSIPEYEEYDEARCEVSEHRWSTGGFGGSDPPPET